jgi:hypothetical protein
VVSPENGIESRDYWIWKSGWRRKTNPFEHSVEATSGHNIFLAGVAPRRVHPIGSNLMRSPSIGRMAFIRRDSLIVARHEVPELEFGYFPRAWGWVGRSSANGPRELSPGFTLGNAPNVRSPEKGHRHFGMCSSAPRQRAPPRHEQATARRRVSVAL